MNPKYRRCDAAAMFMTPTWQLWRSEVCPYMHHKLLRDQVLCQEAGA